VWPIEIRSVLRSARRRRLPATTPPRPRFRPLSAFPGRGFRPSLKSYAARALAHANQRKHQYATLEHLLLALTDDMDASAVLKACNVNLSALKSHLTSYIDKELKNLVIDDGGESKPTAAFQRVGGRVQCSGTAVGSPNSERRGGPCGHLRRATESPGVLLLLEQAMTAYDAVNFVVHGIAKGNGVEAVSRLRHWRSTERGKPTKL